MSIVVEKFLKENEFDLKEEQCRLLESRDINQILSDYMVTSNDVSKNVCMKNIVGYDYSRRNESNDLFTSFSNYFDNNGDSYHSRANGMLNYSVNEIVPMLENWWKNFKRVKYKSR